MLLAVSTCCLLLLYGVPSTLALTPPLATVAQSFGYNLETHPLANSRGYILGVHRLLKQTETAASVNRPPVLIVPGLFHSSDAFLNKNWHYGYYLVNNGYDVWLHNYRGNLYSRQHNTLSPDSEAFHNFTITDMGGDLPNTIDYILEKTGRDTLAYVGCSIGGQLFSALGSFYPEYISKISVFVGVGVIGHPLDTTKSNFRDSLFLVESVLKKLNKPEFVNPISIVGPIIRSFCSGSGWLAQPLCDIAVNMANVMLSGCDKECLMNLMEVGTSNVSEKVLQHYFQMIKYNNLQEFDYGEETNQWLYGSKTPPLYNIAKLTCPIYFLCGGSDVISSLKEVETLAAKLPTRPTIKVLPDYSHANLYLNEIPALVVLDELEGILQTHSVRRIQI